MMRCNETAGREFNWVKRDAKWPIGWLAQRPIFQTGTDMAVITAGNLMINGLSAQARSANAAAERDQAKQAGEAVGPLQISSDSLRVSAGSQAQATDTAGTGGSEAVSALQQLIKDLQKQLAEQQKQLAALQNSKMDETSKAAAVGAKQASIATLNGQIMAATAQLLALLQQEGGSSSGSMVSATA